LQYVVEDSQPAQLQLLQYAPQLDAAALLVLQYSWLMSRGSGQDFRKS
jgi:hypothetical protein